MIIAIDDNLFRVSKKDLANHLRNWLKDKKDMPIENAKSMGKIDYQLANSSAKEILNILADIEK